MTPADMSKLVKRARQGKLVDPLVQKNRELLDRNAELLTIVQRRESPARDFWSSAGLFAGGFVGGLLLSAIVYFAL